MWQKCCVTGLGKRTLEASGMFGNITILFPLSFLELVAVSFRGAHIRDLNRCVFMILLLRGEQFKCQGTCDYMRSLNMPKALNKIAGNIL